MIKAGKFDRTYMVKKTKWIVEGFSERSMRHVYPHQGWSWTDWQPEITDTYETLAQARAAISSGYLKDMIKSQKVKDIRFFEVTVIKEIVEQRHVICHDRKGKAVEYVEPTYATDLGQVRSGDYVVLEYREGGHVYCRVENVRDGIMHLFVINGRWALFLDVRNSPPTVHPLTSNINPGEAIEVVHIGVPDSNKDVMDYNHQLSFYGENFDQNKLTTSGLPHSIST